MQLLTTIFTCVYCYKTIGVATFSVMKLFKVAIKSCQILTTYFSTIIKKNGFEK